MKKIVYMVMVAVVLVTATAGLAEDKDIKEVFKQEQEHCVDVLVRAWLKEKPEADFESLVKYLIRANKRYRIMLMGSEDDSLAGRMVQAMESGKTLKEKVNLAILVYYREKGLKLDSRVHFRRGHFNIIRDKQ